ncbi:MAG: HEAT repeat domain-containing protein [Blastocatellia bacterium]|nr:HEAT repeat domain-containing protein [Blastocatellia bacterium]
MAKKRGDMIAWLRDGLEGRSLKATLRLYLVGLLMLAPVAVLTGFLFGIDTLFFIMPLLVALLVALQYGVRHQARLRSFIGGTSEKEEIRRGVERLIEGMTDKTLGVRWNAGLALEEIKDPRAIEPLIRALSHEDVLVRARAAEALGNIGKRRAVEPLIRALNDEDANVRFRAANSLGKIGDRRAVEPLTRTMSDEDTEVGNIALVWLVKLGDRRVIKHLTDWHEMKMRRREQGKEPEQDPTGKMSTSGQPRK